MKRILSLLTILFILAACNVPFANGDNDDGGETVPADYVQWDADTDTLSKFNGETDIMIWKQHYDYDDQGRCVFMDNTTPGDAVNWSMVFTYGPDGRDGEAYFNGTGELVYYVRTFYDEEGDVSSQARYGGDHSLEWIKVFTMDGPLTSYYEYDGSEELKKAYRSFTIEQYDETLLSTNSLYGADGDRTGYVHYTYNSANDLIAKTGYGAAASSSSYQASPAMTSVKETGGVNTVSRNGDNLTMPTADFPEYAEPVPPALNDRELDYNEFTGYTFPEFGETSLNATVTLNSSYMPVYMRTDASVLDEDIEVYLTYYGDGKLKSKSTRYGGTEALVLEFTYNDDGYLTRLETSGEALILPVDYVLEYDENGLPMAISLYSEGASDDVLLQKFEYVFTGDVTAITPAEFAKADLKIYNYSGDYADIGEEALVQYFDFDYSEVDSMLTLTVMDPKGTPGDESDDSSNGSYRLTYNADELTTSFGSFDKEGNQLWSYAYAYSDFDVDGMVQEGIKTAELKLNEMDLPQAPSPEDLESLPFDVEVLLEEIKNFLPLS